jgi:DNA-binding MarR family transcriptional regulator
MASTQERQADLGWSLGALLRGYLKLSAEALGDLPGGARGFQVLSVAASNSCGNQAQIAESTGLDRTVLTYLIDDLEKAGLVTRTPDPNDRRSRRVTLTDTGSDRLAELTGRMNQVEDRLLAGLPSDDAESLRAIVVRAAHSLDDEAEQVCETINQVAAEASA